MVMKWTVCAVWLSLAILNLYLPCQGQSYFFSGNARASHSKFHSFTPARCPLQPLAFTLAVEQLCWSSCSKDKTCCFCLLFCKAGKNNSPFLCFLTTWSFGSSHLWSLLSFHIAAIMSRSVLAILRFIILFSVFLKWKNIHAKLIPLSYQAL